MHTRMNRFIFTLYAGSCLMLSVQLSAQVLTVGQHIPLCSDSIWAYKLPYVAVTDSGRNCVWDFSDLLTDSAETIDILYFTSAMTDTTRIGLHREHANYYYRCSGDTLWQTGYETAHARVQYSSPLLSCRFPLAFSDSAFGIFNGTGQYCHILPLSIEGSSFIHADAVGRLILPDMAIDTVLRVYSKIQYQEGTYRHASVQEERRQWYARNCRYPLFETVHIQTIKNTDTVTFASSYYFPQEVEPQPMQERIVPDTVIDAMDSLITDVSYLPNPVYTNLKVSYLLVRPAQVYISIHYNGGISTYQTPIRNEEEGPHSVSVNMGGMPIGTYVVYIHADDTIVSGNIIKL